MIAAVLEKLSFGTAASVLFLQARASIPVVLFGAIDLTIAALFTTAYFSTRPGA